MKMLSITGNIVHFYKIIVSIFRLQYLLLSFDTFSDIEGIIEILEYPRVVGFRPMVVRKFIINDGIKRFNCYIWGQELVQRYDNSLELNMVKF